ncbi:WXG100 family type VII secretion target [Nocardia salmonicida]|uniref:WXG100 family type VII secretion target n=1 Tax=Nocardia salmonicida TaxID=53431 RepID=UPI0007A4CCC8|nr:WXG100 family type VII secretion target [Nocardia salmonicida]
MTDLGAIRYDFGAINDAGSGLQAEAQQITTALQDYENEFQRFIEENWSEGEGSTAFSIMQTKWAAQALDLNAKLQQIGAKTLAGSEGMQQTDVRLARMLEG